MYFDLHFNHPVVWHEFFKVQIFHVPSQYKIIKNAYILIIQELKLKHVTPQDTAETAWNVSTRAEVIYRPVWYSQNELIYPLIQSYWNNIWK